MVGPTLLETLQRIRRASTAEVEAMARGAGVPFHTLRKIQSGETRDPRILTVLAVQRYLHGCDVQWPAAHDEQEAA